MKVKILNKFDYQTFPLDDTAIEVSEQILDQIGITKCFDINRNCVVDYRDSYKEAMNRILELKQLLSSTDYQAIKYAEGELSEKDYAPIKKQRREWREEINELEKEIE